MMVLKDTGAEGAKAGAQNQGRRSAKKNKNIKRLSLDKKNLRMWEERTSGPSRDNGGNKNGARECSDSLGDSYSVISSLSRRSSSTVRSKSCPVDGESKRNGSVLKVIHQVHLRDFEDKEPTVIVEKSHCAILNSTQACNFSQQLQGTSQDFSQAQDTSYSSSGGNQNNGRNMSFLNSSSLDHPRSHSSGSQNSDDDFYKIPQNFANMGIA